jgi:copper transport protein
MARMSTTLFSILNLQFLILLIAQALQGHATAFTELSPLRVAADALHLLAAAVWVGGLLALSLTVTPLLRAGPGHLALAWGILRRFGALAAGSLAALLITGLFMSGQQVASLDALLTTLYGRALLLKIGLVAAVALIGLRNAASLHPAVAAALRWRTLQTAATRPAVARTIALEAIGAAAVLLMAACLTAVQPARGPAFDPPVAETQAVAMAQANDLAVTVALKPNRPGENFVTLGVFDTRRPAPAPIDEVAVQFRLLGEPAPVSRPAAALRAGRYELAGASIAGAGDIAIVVTVRRAGLPDAIATFPWTVQPAAQQPRAVLVSNQPLALWADRAALAIVLLLAGLVVGGGAWLRVWHSSNQSNLV